MRHLQTESCCGELGGCGDPKRLSRGPKPYSAAAAACLSWADSTPGDKPAKAVDRQPSRIKHLSVGIFGGQQFSLSHSTRVQTCADVRKILLANCCAGF